MTSRRLFLLGGAAALAAPTAAHARSERKLYLDAHRAWTREVRLYNGFYTALLARGTLLSADFRQAMAEERRRVYAPTEADHQAFLAKMKEEGEQFYDVYLAADSSYDEADKFGGQGDDRWNLRLEVGNVVQPVVDVAHVRQPTPLHRELFPQINIWSELWIARFSRQSGAAGELVLHIGGGYGNTTMTWG